MYCPNCGKPDQEKETYCRQCGVYLSGFGKVSKLHRPVNENFKANLFLTGLTGIVSLTLAITLYAVFLGKENTPVIIYIVAGFLTAMFAWQVQMFLRTIQLKNQFKNQSKTEKGSEETQKTIDSKPTKELLKEADFEDFIPVSVTENSTKNLKEKIRKSS
jgi:NhaP-type Na+/H+ or K+/H+ antiporter